MGQVRPETVVDSAAEGQYRGCALAGDVEAARVLVHSRITVGGKGVDDDERPGGQDDAAELDVLDHGAKHATHYWRVARRFLNRTRRQLGSILQQRPLSRVIAENVNGGGQLVAGGVRSSQQQTGREHAQFVGVEGG